ncbi:MAG: FUSC family protein, partial [Deltaproteobacteria bacterium]
MLSDKAKYSIKLGLAIAITYGLALRANWMSPTWAAIAVAMIGQPGHGQSLYKGMLRAIGTLIAFFCGLFILMLFPQDRWLTLVATSPFLGYFTYRMKGQNSYLWFVAAFVTPMIVMAGPAQPGHAFEFAAYRTLETLMGIGVWALVSIFLWPATNRGALQTAMDELLATQQKILTAFRESATDGDSAG